MINLTAAKLGTNLGEFLADNGSKITPLPNTLLSALSTSLGNCLPDGAQHDKGYIPELMSECSMGENVGDVGGTKYHPSEHDSYMDNYIDELGLHLGNYLSFARNVVNGKVTEFLEELETAISNHRYKDPEDFFNVTYFKLHSIFSSQLVSDEIRTIKGDTANKVLMNLNLAELEGSSPEDLANFLTTGHKETDTEILGWLSTVPNWVSYVLNSLDTFNLTEIETLDYALVNYLFYRHVNVNGDVNTGEGSAAIKRKAFDNKEYYGALVSSTLKLYDMTIKSGKVLANGTDNNFSYLSEEKFEVIVYEENFAKAAEEGVTIETVFGSLASTSSSLDLRVVELVDRKDELNTVWSRTRSLYLVHLHNRKLKIFKHLARVTWDDSLAEANLTDDEKELMGKDPNFLNTTLALGHKLIEESSIETMEALDKFSLDLVAGIRFRFSSAYQLLCTMDELLKADESLDPKEAGLYAAIDYMLEFCLQQATFSRV